MNAYLTYEKNKLKRNPQKNVIIALPEYNEHIYPRIYKLLIILAS